MTNAILRGKPDAGNPHVRFDEGEVASAKPRRGSLLYKNEEEASDYILERLKEVKDILDDIADQTGVVFICFQSEVAEMFHSCGERMIDSLQAIMKIIPDRYDTANQARQYAFDREKKDEELKAEMEKHGQACPEDQGKPYP